MFETTHVEALHRGLLVVLTLAILMLLPVIAWRDTSGSADAETSAGAGLVVVPLPRLPEHEVAPLMARMPADFDGRTTDGTFR